MGSTPITSTNVIDKHIHHAMVAQMSVPRECKICGIEFSPKDKEERRRNKMGFQIVFCSRSCVAVYNNSLRQNTVKPISKSCGFCKKEFMTTTGKLEATFCSRSCASSGSVTEKRREAARALGMAIGKSQNFRAVSSREGGSEIMLSIISKGLKKREKWKYRRVEEFLKWIGEKYEIEGVVCGAIRDLVLPDRRIAVEFDGPDHGNRKCSEQDAAKDSKARLGGWTVIRVKTGRRTEIDPSTLYDIFSTAGAQRIPAG